jgi:nickel-type superoxide dismutase maturation protease
VSTTAPSRDHGYWAVVALLVLVAGFVLRRCLGRVAVAGDSMLPTLRPGDSLLVCRRPRRVSVGDLVTLEDPRQPADPEALIKRVAGVSADGLELLGDNPLQSTDSRVFGPVAPRLLTGKVLYRYAPPTRRGRVL